MPKGSNTKIARDARLTAEADFATWLMMAKLGSFNDLPNNAQTFLMHYQERLKTGNEKDATAATIDEIYAAYYTERGGKGEPPAIVTTPAPSPPSDNVVRLQDARRTRATQPTASSRRPAGPRRVPALLIFIVLVAVVVAIKYLTGGLGW